MTNNVNTTKARIGLIAVVLLFILSPILAWMFYTGVIGAGYQADAGKNYGELIHPARPLENIQLLDANDRPVGRESFLGLWTMLLFADAACDDACLQNIYNMRQIHQALGKDSYRAQYFVVTAGTTVQADIVEKYPRTPFLRVVAASEPMLDRFPAYNEAGIASISGRVYLVDPQANLMMQYPPVADPSGILKDLRQLLKATWIRPVN